MIRPRSLAALALLLWCAACATVPVHDNVPPFDLLGRILVGRAGPSFASNLRWWHAAGRDRIWLMTPLGQTVAYIESGPGGATLTAADRREYHAGSVESLTREALGWALPVEQLRYWVRGVPAPGSEPTAMRRASDGQLLGFDQDGWRIALLDVQSASRLPHRLDLSNGAQRIRMVIDDWRPVNEKS